MNWILGVIIILILLFLFSNYRKKKRIKKTQNDLLNNWSKQKSQGEFHFESIKKYFNNNNEKKMPII